jgi:hypothetical protein
MGPGPPGRGVDMLRNTWRASVRTELSIALAAWSYDSWETLSEPGTNVLDCPANYSCIPPRGSESRREGPAQRSPGLILFCRCPRVAASIENKSGDRRLAGEGIHLMSDIPEL